jgi:hypothetical protein
MALTNLLLFSHQQFFVDQVFDDGMKLLTDLTEIFDVKTDLKCFTSKIVNKIRLSILFYKTELRNTLSITLDSFRNNLDNLYHSTFNKQGVA